MHLSAKQVNELQLAVADRYMLYADAVAYSELPGDTPLERLAHAADCLRVSLATCDVLRGWGYECELEAGSAFWMCNPIEEYGYQWGDYNWRGMIAVGLLPEVHIWARCEDRIVDVAALGARHGAQRCGLVWIGSDPETLVSEGQGRARYVPHVSATAMAREVGQELVASLQTWGVLKGGSDRNVSLGMAN